jgi:hypothetical protein
MPPQDAAAADRAELFVLSGPDVGRSHAIVHGSTLGRSPDRDVVLRDKSISRHHAHFECAGGVWSIVDDGSTNGFQVDGVRSERAVLGDLREFLVGEVLVRLRTQFTAPAAPTASTAQAASTASPSPTASGESAAPSAYTAPRPAPAAAAQAPAASASDLGDEIEIDSDPEATSPTLVRRAPPAPPAPAPAPPAPAAPAPGAGARTAATPGPTPRGQRVLQYHKQEARHGLLVTDLDQRPAWLRALLVAVALAIAGGLAWAAYRGVLSVREDLSAEETPDSPPEPGR